MLAFGNFSREFDIVAFMHHFGHVGLVEPNHRDCTRAIFHCRFAHWHFALECLASLEFANLSVDGRRVADDKITDEFDFRNVCITDRKVVEDITDGFETKAEKRFFLIFLKSEV